MKSYLKNYKLKLTALSPIFIGSGSKIKKSEYVFDGKYVYIADPKKLMNVITGKNLVKSFINSMNFQPGAFNLKVWLDKNFIRDYNSISSYKLSGVENIDARRSLKEINACIKNAYGEPYIPGSSIKGALRTVILWDKIYANYNRLNKARNIAMDALNEPKRGYMERNLNRIAANLEKTLLNVNIEETPSSIMRGLIVGDSKPLSLDDIVLCEKIDVGVDKHQKKPNILRECIKPGTVIESDITIDSSILKIDADTLMEKINNYSMDYHDIITTNFPYKEDVENTLFLGGGAGYFSKTVSYRLFDDDAVDFVRKYLAKTTNRTHNHMKDRIISPHMQKCTMYGGKMYEMGKCSVELEEVSV